MHTKVLVPKLRMTKWLVLLSFMILILFAVSPVQAVVNVIQPGNEVFIGEQGLDVSLAVGGYQSVAMWVGSDHTIEPTNAVIISNPNNFPISAAEFRNFPGHYYQYNSSPTPSVGNEAFLVSEPTLSVNLYDDQALVPTGQSRYVGTKFNFEIVSNLFKINTERSAPGFTNLLVRDQTGITYSSLSTMNNPGGKPLQNLILSAPFFWSTQGVLGDYWNTAATGWFE